MNIKAYYEEGTVRIRNWKKIKSLIEKVIRGEKKKPGDLSFIFTTDTEIKKLNEQFLGRDYYTDVIAFDYCEGTFVSGDIYISTDTVRKNAKNYEVSYKEEIVRVCIHGTLHLCGYRDKTMDERENMRRMENYWIDRL